MKITLNHVWVHDANDYSQFVVLRQKPGATFRHSAEVSRRSRADGRWQTVRGAGTDQALPINAGMVGRDSFEKLQEFCGRRVMVRDSRGRIIWGVYAEILGVEARARRDTLETVSFTVAPSGTQSAAV